MARKFALIFLTGGSALCGWALVPELLSYETDWRSAGPWVITACIAAVTLVTVSFWSCRMHYPKLAASAHLCLGACLLWVGLECIRAGNYEGAPTLFCLALLAFCPFAAAGAILRANPRWENEKNRSPVS